MAELQRFAPRVSHIGTLLGSPRPVMAVDPQGDWVRLGDYGDVCNELAALRDRLAEAERLLREISGCSSDFPSKALWKIKDKARSHLSAPSPAGEADRKSYDELVTEGIESDLRGDRFSHALGQLANEVLGLRWTERHHPTEVMDHHKWPSIMEKIVAARRMLAVDDPEDDEEPQLQAGAAKEPPE